MKPMEVSEIAAMLDDRVDTLVPELLSAARRSGQEWEVGSIAGEKGQSLKIHRSGPRKGVWKDFAGGLTGDMLELVAHVHFAGDKAKAISWARRWLGIDNMDPDAMEKTRARIQKKTEDDERKALEDAKRRAKIAQALWLNAGKELSGTPVDRYLLGRGIDLRDLPRPPGSLRFAPALDYPSDQNNGVRSSWPAMVAMVQKDGLHVATHRTYLEVRKSGLVMKAPVSNAKLSLGPLKGGFIALQRGASDVPMSRAPQGDKLIISEGIEDGLTMGASCPLHRVIAAVSSSNFINIKLPAAIRDITIVGQNKDAPGSQAMLAIQAAMDRWIDEGRDVRHWLPPAQFGDVNEMAQAGAGIKPAREAK